MEGTNENTNKVEDDTQNTETKEGNTPSDIGEVAVNDSPLLFRFPLEQIPLASLAFNSTILPLEPSLSPSSYDVSILQQQSDASSIQSSNQEEDLLKSQVLANMSNNQSREYQVHTPQSLELLRRSHIQDPTSNVQKRKFESQDDQEYHEPDQTDTKMVFDLPMQTSSEKFLFCLHQQVHSVQRKSYVNENR